MQLLHGETPVRSRQCRGEWKNKNYFSGTRKEKSVSEKMYTTISEVEVGVASAKCTDASVGAT
jgi:hypothetical protein